MPYGNHSINDRQYWTDTHRKLSLGNKKRNWICKMHEWKKGPLRVVYHACMTVLTFRSTFICGLIEPSSTKRLIVVVHLEDIGYNSRRHSFAVFFPFGAILFRTTMIISLGSMQQQQSKEYSIEIRKKSKMPACKSVACRHDDIAKVITMTRETPEARGQQKALVLLNVTKRETKQQQNYGVSKFHANIFKTRSDRRSRMHACTCTYAKTHQQHMHSTRILANWQ